MDTDPAARLRRLFMWAVEAGSQDRVELALLATADHPLVAPVLQRVTERRISYLTAVFVEFGLEVGQARSRAVLAYSAFLGHIQLAHATPQVLAAGIGERRGYLDGVMDALLSPP